LNYRRRRRRDGRRWLNKETENRFWNKWW